MKHTANTLILLSVSLFLTVSLFGYVVSSPPKFMKTVGFMNATSNEPNYYLFQSSACMELSNFEYYSKCVKQGFYTGIECNNSCSECADSWITPFGREKQYDRSCIQHIPSIPDTNVVIVSYPQVNCTGEIHSWEYYPSTYCMIYSTGVWMRRYCQNGIAYENLCKDAQCTQGCSSNIITTNSCFKGSSFVFMCGLNTTFLGY
eukprot:TRINITY_DN2156_c0_g4_i7.p1 TRINITY_DN2156_c0_g4~~TRINITY_DN2156_c0_g4_i7.p1  ORF type:complete len:203 (-),score=12.77 TRINITY_DN2156_c0_g4_i7:131-739(-)